MPDRARRFDFEAAWPWVQPRVAAVLGARGVQAADADDIVQEVALRALRHQGSFDSDEHFLRWCCRVAINLHIDSTRSQRRLTDGLREDEPSREDTARTAERRLDLVTLTAGISELSAEEQQLLLDPGPTSSRQEAVRLAVRRHRIRARLAALIEGVVVAVPVLRKLLRSLSTPAKVGVAALPVVATLGFLLAPSIQVPWEAGHGPASQPAVTSPAPLGGQAQLIGTTVPRTPSRPSTSVGGGTKPGPTSNEPPARRPGQTIAAVDTPVVPVAVTKEQVPDDAPTLCTGLLERNTCVDRPGPNIPHPPLPLP
jgi:RNA polymerase sigma factor (sigma-70 family)